MSDELYHYGVVGMKWGVRRARRKEAKATYRKETGKAFKEYERSISRIEKSYKRGQNLSSKDMAREMAAEKKYQDAAAKAKSEYKKAVKSTKNDARYAREKGYHKGAFDRVNKMGSGKAIAQSMLLGSYGALKYNQFRSEGKSKGESTVSAIMSNWANNVTLGQLGRWERKNRRNS